MKYILFIICLFVGVNVFAQSDSLKTPPDTTISKNLIKKAKNIRKNCIKIDTAISQMKQIQDTQIQIIARLKELKKQKLIPKLNNEKSLAP